MVHTITHLWCTLWHPVAPCGAPYGVTYLIPAEPYYRSPEKLNLLALLTYPRTLKCRESWAGILYTPQYLAYEAMETSAGPLWKCFSDILLEVYIYLPGFNLQQHEVLKSLKKK